MAFYTFIQQVGGDEDWELILADLREQTLRDRNPMFATILDLDNDYKVKPDAEAMARIRYRGPLYFDFDSKDLEEVIPQFQKFLKQLQEDQRFALDQALLYATGGKGFHAIIPEACFIPKVPANGSPGRAAVYKEMAMDLFVDTLDLRVYTGKRGRMFRNANVKRENGHYKVPISVREAFAMTPEMYLELTSNPRPLIVPDEPQLNNALALLYAGAADKVEKALKGKKKSKVDEKLLQRWGGEVPDTLLALMRGEISDPDKGFNEIAQQISISCVSLGKTEEQMLDLCGGLIRNHSGDGTRYGSPAKRRRELSRMYDYMVDNPCWEFSVGGLKSVLARDVKTPDLDSQGVTLEDEEQADEDLDPALAQGMRINTTGIYRKHEGELIKICAMGLAAPKMLLNLKTEEVVGYEVDIYVDGVKKCTRNIEMGTFASRTKFQAFTLATAGANMIATDAQVGAVADFLRARAVKSGDVVYTLQAEGLDVVVLPDSKIDVVWADRYGVQSSLGIAYRLAGALTTESEYNTDLFMAPDLEVTDETRQFFHDLFSVNQPEVVAKFFGWYIACFLSQPIRHVFNQFPSLQVFGQAGSGKSKSTELFARMHYFRKKPKLNSALSITPFAMEALASGSASMPFIIDEYKPRAMKQDRLEKLKSVLRDNYVSLEVSKGRVSSETGTSKLMLTSARNAAPICTIGEQAEVESAIQERVVSIPLTKEGKRGHGEPFHRCNASAETLSSFGRMVMGLALTVQIQKLAATVEKNRKIVNDHLGDEDGDNARPVFNMAVILTGLDIGQRILGRLFGAEEYVADFDRLRNSIMSDREVMAPRQVAEFAKVLDSMAYMSRLPNSEEHRVRLTLGEDYLPTATNIELSLRRAYEKYVRHTRSLGEEILFDNIRAFQLALDNSGLVVDRRCVNSELKEGHQTTLVYAFDIEKLAEAGVSEFHLGQKI